MEPAAGSENLNQSTSVLGLITPETVEFKLINVAEEPRVFAWSSAAAAKSGGMSTSRSAIESIIETTRFFIVKYIPFAALKAQIVMKTGREPRECGIIGLKGKQLQSTVR
jgi:hypothetical protein